MIKFDTYDVICLLSEYRWILIIFYLLCPDII